MVNGDTGAYDGTAGKPMKKENSQRDRSGPRDRSGEQKMPKRGGRNHKNIPANKRW